MKKSSFLDFVVIGAMKAGTTSLYNYLAQHPQLSVPCTEKEVNFFNNNSHWNAGISWYEKNFENNNLKRGEVNPNYAMFPRCQVVPERLYQFSPDVKIIYILRDPIERLRSHIHHNYIKGFESRSITEILEDQEDSLWYIAYSKYYYQLEKFLTYFERSQILVTTLENLSKEPISVMSYIFDFLEVDKNFFLNSYREKVHASNEKVKSGKLLNFLRKSPLMEGYQRLKPLIPLNTHIRAKRLLGKHIEKPNLNENQISYLQSLFCEDISNLEAFLECSFSNWKYDYSVKSHI